ncbi:DUF2057 domain-containing protein [Aeromonas veronii]|uniref:DUF2057 domain-containing protein n=1 Tax=Aeromonas veronii TaxID=654 RepID=A0AAW5M6J9_AERVE|nr:DUF2057 domain-containing protein [Aeromonas veronii]HDT6075747.1 DUF2057 domain-containing protein [Aeromonas veronii bv. veronii]MBL0488119.1 DUF2057 domain-containing protein [Aeromonas veronii]MCR4446875.1 DUF2057 domain-containing protein [Aeromonas veronii]TNI41353.1 DUF2057 domain-containing protein [Aeromonas veronii]TNJ17808.1 DUF2057 domain-containing protein [Aeromonas veronii]
MKSNQGLTGFVLLCAALGAGSAQAVVEVKVPDNFRILAVSNGTLQDEQHATLADGEQQLLVRFEGIIPSRSSSENDRQVRSEPQVVRYQGSNQHLQLTASVPGDERGMQAYAKAPLVGLQESGRALAIQQDALVTSGILLGVDWNGKLAEYNRSGGKAALTAVAVAAPPAATVSSGAQPLAASELEGQLQQLFLKADPALRKRFIGWAVPQL